MSRARAGSPRYMNSGARSRSLRTGTQDTGNAGVDGNAGFANSIMDRSTPAVPAVVFSKLAALKRNCLPFTPGEERSGKG